MDISKLTSKTKLKIKLIKMALSLPKETTLSQRESRLISEYLSALELNIFDFNFDDLKVCGSNSGDTGIMFNYPDPGDTSITLKHIPSGKKGFVTLNSSFDHSPYTPQSKKKSEHFKIEINISINGCRDILFEEFLKYEMPTLRDKYNNYTNYQVTTPDEFSRRRSFIEFANNYKLQNQKQRKPKNEI